ncbi:MAG: 50S ribosomal protein L21 [Pseudomonadota bacterium]
MFAVIKTGGKQYKVSAGDQFAVEKLAAEPGETVQFNEVLMLGGDEVSVGTPVVADAGVKAEVIDQGRGDKVYNFKKRRRKHSSKRLKGHRQSLTTVKILEILAAGADKSGVKAALGAGSAPKDTAEAAPAKPVKKATPKAKAEKTPVAEAPAVAASRPANLLDAAKGDADDLTKISGVGPKLQEKLNENGVYHFWQIAEWGPEELAFMDDQLSFKGRMERDEWIKQAKEFAADSE